MKLSGIVENVQNVVMVFQQTGVDVGLSGTKQTEIANMEMVKKIEKGVFQVLTKREYEQLKIAFEAMHSVNLVGTGHMVCRESVIAILARWVDFGDKIEPVPEPSDGERLKPC